MAYVSVDEFRQYMAVQEAKHQAVFDRMETMQQSIVELRGQTSVAQVDIDNKFQLLGDGFALRIVGMETSGNQLIADVQVAQANLQSLAETLQGLMGTAETNCAKHAKDIEEKLNDIKAKTEIVIKEMQGQFTSGDWTSPVPNGG